MSIKNNHFHYCPNCLSTSLRPNGWFDKGSICFPCESEKNIVFTDYLSRVNSLRSYISELKCKYTQNSNSRFDCVVGVSGGKDSTRQALWVRERLGMNPLLVCVTYPPIQSTELGKDNLKNLVELGFDIVTYTPAPETSRKLTRESFYNFGNVSKATEMALHSQVPKVAMFEDIKLIFWGDNPATQTGDMATLGKNVFDGNNLRKMNTLTDGDSDWILSAAPLKSQNETYFYPDASSIENQGINTLYLGPALDRWTMLDNSVFSILHGLLPNKKSSISTGDYLKTSMLDEEYTNINMMIKYYKFGFGRATDLVNGLIRDGTMTRDEAIEIVREMDGRCSDEIIMSFCDYIEINVSEFWDVVNKYINKDLFYVSKSQRPKPRFEVGKGLVS